MKTTSCLWLGSLALLVAAAFTACQEADGGYPAPSDGSGNACQATADCPAGEECHTQICRIPPGGNNPPIGAGGGNNGASCVSDVDCAANETCVNQSCENSADQPDAGGNPNACTLDSDCPFGEKCNSGACQTDNTPDAGGNGGCLSDTDCNIGQICQNSACISGMSDGGI